MFQVVKNTQNINNTNVINQKLSNQQTNHSVFENIVPSQQSSQKGETNSRNSQFLDQHVKRTPNIQFTKTTTTNNMIIPNQQQQQQYTVQNVPFNNNVTPNMISSNSIHALQHNSPYRPMPLRSFPRTVNQRLPLWGTFPPPPPAYIPKTNTASGLPQPNSSFLPLFPIHPNYWHLVRRKDNSKKRKSSKTSTSKVDSKRPRMSVQERELESEMLNFKATLQIQNSHQISAINKNPSIMVHPIITPLTSNQTLPTNHLQLHVANPNQQIHVQSINHQIERVNSSSNQQITNMNPSSNQQITNMNPSTNQQITNMNSSTNQQSSNQQVTNMNSSTNQQVTNMNPSTNQQVTVNNTTTNGPLTTVQSPTPNISALNNSEKMEQSTIGASAQASASHETTTNTKKSKTELNEQGSFMCAFCKKTFMCAFCKKTFMYRCDFVRHLRTHTNERPYICDMCGKTFKQKGTLTTHKRTHTGERPFGCKVCGKRFTQKSPLTAHMRTHTNIRPYQCDICGKSFKQRGNLTTHRRTHMKFSTIPIIRSGNNSLLVGLPEPPPLVQYYQSPIASSKTHGLHHLNNPTQHNITNQIANNHQHMTNNTSSIPGHVNQTQVNKN